MKATEVVDYVRLNLAIRRLCLWNLVISWLCGILLTPWIIPKQFNELNYLLGNPFSNVFTLPLFLASLAAFPVIAVSLFLSCVFAFGAIATNSISGQNRLRLNVLPILCIFLSCPSLSVLVGYVFEVRLL